MPDSDQFEADFLTQTGLTIEATFDPPHAISAVRVECLDDGEWVGLLNTQGEYLHECCAQVSHIRDLLFKVLRNDKVMSVNDLRDVIVSYRQHSHMDGELEDGPFRKLADLLNQITPHAAFDSGGFSEDPSTLEGAAEIIAAGCKRISFNTLASADIDPQVCQLYELHLLAPAVTTLYRAIQEKQLPPLEGHAITHKGKVMILRNGVPAVLPTRQKAQEWLDGFRQKDDYSIRPVRVTVDKGYEFI